MSKLTLEELISKAQMEMRTHGYCEKSIYCAYLYIWIKLYDYNNPKEELKEVVIEQFLNDYFRTDLSKIEKEHLSINQRRYLRAFDVLIKVNNNIELETITKIEYKMSDTLNKIYKKFITLANENNNSERTIKNKKRVIKLFIKKSNFNNPTRQNIINYLESLNTKKTITNTIDNRLIRKFLELCYEENYINIDILRLWPDSFPNRNCSNVPSEYSNDEIKTLLIESFNFKNEDCHLRNYSILSTVTYTGLRASDICNLKFENIDWNLNKITIIQQKTKKEVSFPLISQIGNPLIDYITNERPKSSSNYIYLTEKGEKLTPTSITTIINRYFINSTINIKNKHYGAHALRHSLSTILINNEIPAYNISKTLGHSDTRTLNIYSKVNLTQLRKCVIEVPYE